MLSEAREAHSSMVLEYREILKEELEKYRELMLPMIYEELIEQEDMESEYFCIAAELDNEPVGVIIAEPEGSGDINLLSIWVAQEYRGLGIATELRKKMLDVALRLYDWEESQYGDDVTLKVMYCLSGKYRESFEAWLRANDFTDFFITRPAEDNTPDVCGAASEIHFYRT